MGQDAPSVFGKVVETKPKLFSEGFGVLSTFTRDLPYRYIDPWGNEIPFPIFYNSILLPAPEHRDVCVNTSILSTSESGLQDELSKQIVNASGGKQYIQQLGLIHRLFCACRASRIQSCDNGSCADYKKTLRSLIPSCKTWKGFENWALQVAACICSRTAGICATNDDSQLSALPGVITYICKDYHGLYPTRDHTYDVDYGNGEALETAQLLSSFIDWAEAVELADVLGILSWLNAIVTGCYEVVREPIELHQPTRFNVQEHARGGIFTAAIAEAVERAKNFKLCPHRVWAIAACLPDQEFNLPALIPLGKDFSIPGHDRHNHRECHCRCTFDFCEESVKNFTSVKQRHECSDNKSCEKTQKKLQLGLLDSPALAGKPTAWKLDGSSIIEPNQPFMAISHVWADGTGAGKWPAGEVNICLYDFFGCIAKELKCEGVWWDAICIPRKPEARSKAINNMHNNYAKAEVTLVHDRYLRNCEWRDPENASLAIVMSSWFTRGWTALELAKSRVVKVLFKSGVIKDLDKDILAKPGEPCSTYRQVATRAILNLRRKITDVNSLLTALSTRHTSWQRDRAIIAGLLVELAGLENPNDPAALSDPNDPTGAGDSLQHIYQRILKEFGGVSDGHLFHSSATMPEGFSWCPTSLLDMPLAIGRPSPLILRENGGVVGYWSVLELAEGLSMEYVWRDTHPLTKTMLQLALRRGDKHLLLAERRVEIITRALLVKVMRKVGEDNPTEIHCKFVGPVHFRSIGGNAPVGDIEITIGDTSEMVELGNETALEYVHRVWEERKKHDPSVIGGIQMTLGSVGLNGVHFPDASEAEDTGFTGGWNTAESASLYGAHYSGASETEDTGFTGGWSNLGSHSYIGRTGYTETTGKGIEDIGGRPY